MKFPLAPSTIPWITTDQMIEVDRLMIVEYGIQLIQMMENAGRALALLAKAHSTDNQVYVLAGKGGNGGGAMVAARRLSAWGIAVKVYTTVPWETLSGVPKIQANALHQMGVEILTSAELPNVIKQGSIILDGIIGYSLQGAPRGSSKEMINWANSQEAHIISLDTPSGIDLTSGKVFEPVIRANQTLTLALPKIGLKSDSVLPMVGELFLADISVPPALYRSPSLNLEVGVVFRSSDIVSLP